MTYFFEGAFLFDAPFLQKKGSILAEAIFGVLFSIDINIAMKSLLTEMMISIDEKMPNYLSFIV